MALFDLPAPALSFLDGTLDFMPPVLRILLWGLVSGVLSMLLYAALSPQGRLSGLKQELQKARGELAASDESFDELLELVQKTLGLSFKHLGLVLLPAIIASLPLISVLAWASNEFGYQFPVAGSSVKLEAFPLEAADELRVRQQGAGTLTTLTAQQLIWPGPGEHSVLEDSEGRQLLALPAAAPIPQIHKKLWWNSLVGNPMGYLPEETKFEVIMLELPGQQHLSFGPSWLGHWLTLFFSALVVSALLTKFILKIE